MSFRPAGRAWPALLVTYVGVSREPTESMETVSYIPSYFIIWDCFAIYFKVPTSLFLLNRHLSQNLDKGRAAR